MHSSSAFQMGKIFSSSSSAKQQQPIAHSHPSTNHANYSSRIRSIRNDTTSNKSSLEDLDALRDQIPPSFKRLVARRTGNSFSEVAEIEEVPMLVPKEGEVLVKVAFAGINGGCETFRARGEHAFAGNRSVPLFTLGAEGAGTIVAVGPGVPTQLCLGQHITFVGGAFSEYVIAKAALCWPVSSASPEAVALTISGTVANAALKYVGKMKAGDTLLVTAAAGATGSFAVQLAREAGCRVVATCGSEKKAERLRALGLDRVINYKQEDVYGVLDKEFGGKIDIAYEGVGGGLQAAAWNALRRPGGRLLPVGYISEYPHVKSNIRQENEQEQQRASDLPPSAELFWSGKLHKAEDGRVCYGKVWPNDRSDILKAKQEIFGMYNNGKIEAWVDQNRKYSGLDDIRTAIEYMLTGEACGKVVVQLSD